MTIASAKDRRDNAPPSRKEAGKTTPIRVLIIDDHALFRSGLVTLIEGLFPGAEIIQAATAAEAIAAAEKIKGIRLILVDLMLPDDNGFDLLGKLVTMLPDTPVAVISATENLTAMTRAYKAGAKGYIVKSATAEKLRHVLPLILSGEAYIPAAAMAALLNPAVPDSANNMGGLPSGATALTRRQLQILKLMAQGMQNKDIATELDTLEGTVKVHVRNILQKLGVNNRTHAVVKAIRTGLVSADTELPQDDRQD